MPGGESSVFDNLTRLLSKVNQEVEIYSRHNLDIPQFSTRDKILMGIQGFFSLRTWNVIRRLVWEKHPQVAIVQNVFPLISPSVYYALKSLNVPIIQSVYNYRFICPGAHLFANGEICEKCINGNYLYSIRKKCYRQKQVLTSWYAANLFLHRFIDTFVRKIDIFMVPDDFLGNKLIMGGIPPSKIRKNINPFFVEDYHPCFKQGKFFLYVGRLVKQKGIFTLVKAMSKVVTNKLPLYIVGEGEERKKLELSINQLGLQDRVKLLGAIWGEEMLQIMKDSSFMVIPSEWYDNFPLIICQAYAFGKPVIASDINGIPEYIDNGVDGLLFTPGDFKGLARCIDNLANDPSLVHKMSINARKKAENIFDFSNYWDRLNSIIHELIR
jgi:glycosyltransferase involved in cell wall biosynthesis